MIRTPRPPAALAALPLTALTLAACERPDGSLQDQLEALTVEATDATGAPLAFDDAALGFSGTLSVAGPPGDPRLRLARADGDLDIALHLPGASDLAWLDGAAVTVALPPDVEYERWTADPLVISDDAGPAFVAQLVGHAPDAADPLFGAGFIRYGAEHGYDEQGTRGFYTRSAVLATDDGPLEVLPGEVHGVRIDGIDWRFVLIAAYEVDGSSGEWDAAAKCIGPPDAMSFEMVRVAPPQGDETLIVRPDGEAPAVGPGCGA